MVGDMGIRKAKISDYDDLRPLFDEVHALSPFGHVPLNEGHMKRMFAMACTMPLYFCMVSVGKDDKARGIFAGQVGPNVWGAMTATDILVYSKYDTPRLIRAYRTWGLCLADIVNITQMTNNPRYQRLIELCGFTKTGNVFSGGL